MCTFPPPPVHNNIGHEHDDHSLHKQSKATQLNSPSTAPFSTHKNKPARGHCTPKNPEQTKYFSAMHTIFVMIIIMLFELNYWTVTLSDVYVMHNNYTYYQCLFTLDSL